MVKTKIKKDDKPEFIKWVKPNKTEIKTNTLPATIAYAQELGWKRKK